MCKIIFSCRSSAKGRAGEKNQRHFTVTPQGGRGLASPGLAAPANLKISPAPLAGLQCRPLQAIDSGLRKHFIAISKFHRRGEHCSPAKALQCRKAPRVEQSPTPTINRERVRLNFSAISQFHRRGGAWLRPLLPHRQPPKSAPSPLAGLPCRPLQAKDSGWHKIILLFCNSIVGASIARPPLPHLQTSNYPPPRWRGRRIFSVSTNAIAAAIAGIRLATRQKPFLLRV